MLYLDGISLNKIKKEFENELLGKKVGKISQDSELSISLIFGKLSLVLSCNQSLPIAYLSQDKTDSINENFGFLLSLKKYLLNAQLLKIEQLGLDRILCFHFAKMNELGEINHYKLYFEIMGRHSNIIIVDSRNNILDLLKKFSIEENNLRILLPGADYVQPIIEIKGSPLIITDSDFNNMIIQGGEPPYKKLEGIGKQLSDNIKSYSDLQNILNSKITPTAYYLNDKLIFASVLKEVTPKEFDNSKNFNSFSELAQYYISNMFLSSAMNNTLSLIKSAVNKRIKKVEKILENIKLDNIEKADFVRYKEIADILSANMYSLKKYSESVDLYDFYNNEMVHIELDKKATPQKNIDSYYKKYNKLKRGLESNKTRFIVVSDELNYLNSVLAFTEASKTIENLKNILKELRNQGYIKDIDKKKIKNKKESSKINYEVAEQTDNYSIIYGRNNLENDFVTFKVAEKDNLWFHVKDVPGSHVILRCHKKNITDELVSKCAQVAINFSKLNLGDKGVVEYTERRFVTKPNGARPGFVIYTNQKEITLKKNAK
ncbi:MAG: NFACT family protein [Fusobacteriaceae bacterium]|nr:NFACT family protein [Fusobacteriaceae bacterium]MBP9510027.1 NFACT family protein [Fusobacteriaceae bacterium]